MDFFLHKHPFHLLVHPKTGKKIIEKMHKYSLTRKTILDPPINAQAQDNFLFIPPDNALD